MVVSKRVQALLEGGIKLLALDFDLTICSAHTHGRYLGSPEDLHMLLYPEMIALIEGASREINVAVTTFSPQTQLISSTMKIISPEKDILVRGSFKCETVEDILNEGKQTHIHSVLDELSKKNGHRLKLNQVILIDDQFDNVRAAVANGSYGLFFQGPSCLSALDKPLPSKNSLLLCKCHPGISMKY